MEFSSNGYEDLKKKEKIGVTVLSSELYISLERAKHFIISVFLAAQA